MEEKIKICTSGKRKRAIAKAFITSGTGKILFNKRDYKNFHNFERLRIEEPLRIAKEILGGLKFDVLVRITGGGRKGQIEAGRLALAKAIIKYSNSEKLKDAYLKYDRNLLIADVRRKEANKPGDSKARAKRQTSYR